MNHRRLVWFAGPGALALVVVGMLIAGCPGDDAVTGDAGREDKASRPPRDDRTEPQPPRFNPDAPWKGHRAAFTFSTDDGNDANLVWAEVARERNIRFTIFVTSDWVGGRGKLTWADLRTLHDDGFEIGGHSLSHPRMTELDDAALEKELAGNQTALEKGLARPDYACQVFAYPFHDHDGRVIAQARRFYIACRNGGLSSLGWPGFSRSTPLWGDINIYEVPLSITMAALVMHNEVSEVGTRDAIRGHMTAWKNRQFWVNIYAHDLRDVDGEHLGWLLDEIIADGGFWIAPFGEVAQYYRETTQD